MACTRMLACFWALHRLLAVWCVQWVIPWQQLCANILCSDVTYLVLHHTCRAQGVVNVINAIPAVFGLFVGWVGGNTGRWATCKRTENYFQEMSPAVKG